MAGYGNRTAPDFVETDEHANTRLGLHDSHHAYSDPHDTYGSGATGGAGFGTFPFPFPSLPFLFPHFSPLFPHFSSCLSQPIIDE
jgi:hypothetical protein